MKRFSIHTALFLLLLAALFGCKEHIADTSLGNKTPNTYLWLYPDSTVGTGVSRSHLHWWGEDPDGVVQGYLFAYKIVQTATTTLPMPDTLRYVYTTATDSIVLFPLDSLYRKFVVVVRAVDNTCTGLTSGSVIRMYPTPYWDKDDDGVYDNQDVYLTQLSSAVDPAGAVQTFPIRNTPPTVAFTADPSDETKSQKQPDTTYTAATFVFTAADDDGHNTLVSYRIALNDTSSTDNWVTIPLRDSMITIVVPRSRSDAAGSGATVVADVYAGTFLGRQYLGQIPGLKLDALNFFYVESKDVAGEYSGAARMPSGSDHWYVKRPTSSMLLVSDYVNTDSSTALSTYLNSLSAVGSGEFSSVDRLNIGQGVTLSGKSGGSKGVLVPAYPDPALINTFLLFDYVVWYTDQYPSLKVAQSTLFTYLENGGKVLFSTSFLNTSDPTGALTDFAPIDSVSGVDLSTTRPSIPPAVAGDTRIPASYIVYADSTYASDIYPQLQFNATPVNHSIYMRPIYKRSDARYIYHLQEDARTPTRYLGTPNLAVVDGSNTIIFVGLPLHLLNNTTNGLGLTAFFEKAFADFAPSQIVNRMKF